MAKKKRDDTAVRISRWLDKAIELHISHKKVRLRFPTKRNFVDQAVLQFLEAEGVKFDN